MKKLNHQLKITELLKHVEIYTIQENVINTSKKNENDEIKQDTQNINFGTYAKCVIIKKKLFDN